MIETGRFNEVNISHRICPVCHSDIEDEFHFILKCPFYKPERMFFIKLYYRRNHSVFKLVQLLSTTSANDLPNLGKFLNFAFKKRSDIIFNSS